MKFNKSKLLSVVFVLFFTFQAANAIIPIEQIKQILPNNTAFTFIAKNISNQSIITSILPDTLMVPASVQKIFTALAAKKELGSDYKFVTSLLTNGQATNDGVLNGDLIVKFTGDPVFRSADLKDLLFNLKKYNIQKITGDIIIDSSVFTGANDAGRQRESDYISCYAAPGSAINIDKNCLTVLINTNTGSNHASITDTALTRSVNINANIVVNRLNGIAKPSKKGKKSKLESSPRTKSITKKTKNGKKIIKVVKQNNVKSKVVQKWSSKHCGLSVKLSDRNSYSFDGCLRNNIKVWYYRVAIHDPISYAGRLTKNYLDELGIQVGGAIKVGVAPQQAKVIADHSSPILDILIKNMLKNSDNQIADTLFRAVAYHLYKKPVSFNDSGQAMVDILTSLDIPVAGNNTFKDGSGLSRDNRISANLLLNVLNYIAQNNNDLHLIEEFPIAGVDGTLKHRASLQYPSLVNNIVAKTGSMKDICNLAGYMKNDRNELIAFVQLVNHYSKNVLGRKRINDVEEMLYKNLYWQ